MGKTVAVKNKADLLDIPEENLFVSESGYAYDINQIVEFISGDWAFTDFQNPSEIAGIFRDYKNKEPLKTPNAKVLEPGLALNLFSEKDITNLLTHPVVRSAFENSPIFSGLHDYADGVNEVTLNLIGKIVIASQILENALLSADQNKLTAELHEPLAEFKTHLDQLKKVEKNPLIFLTSKDGPISSYSDVKGRRCNFVEDVNNLLSGECGAGFNRHVANLYNALKSYKLYQHALKSSLTMQDAPREKKEPSSLQGLSIWNTKKEEGEENQASVQHNKSTLEPK
ncbi:hypothetical protein [Legionella sp. WA2022007384]